MVSSRRIIYKHLSVGNQQKNWGTPEEFLKIVRRRAIHLSRYLTNPLNNQHIRCLPIKTAEKTTKHQSIGFYTRPFNRRSVGLESVTDSNNR